MIIFRKIDLERDISVCIEFREDSFKESFPLSDDWKDQWDEGEYRTWLLERAKQYPEGFLHIWRDEEIIGQLEFKYENSTGHINLYYLRADCRGMGYGFLAHEHVVRTLLNHKCNTATLRVSPTNVRAIAFYKKIGWVDRGQDKKYSNVHTYTIDL